MGWQPSQETNSKTRDANEPHAFWTCWAFVRLGLPRKPQERSGPGSSVCFSSALDTIPWDCSIAFMGREEGETEKTPTIQLSDVAPHWMELREEEKLCI